MRRRTIWGFVLLLAMDSREDKTPKQSEVILISATAVPDLGKQANIVTTKEKISAYFTIAAAAFGLISDGCKSEPCPRVLADIAVCSELTMQKRSRSEQPHDHDQCMWFAVSVRRIRYGPDYVRWCLNACIQKTIHHLSLRGFPMHS